MSTINQLQALLQVIRFMLVNQMISLAGADKAEADLFHLLVSWLKQILRFNCTNPSMIEIT